MLNTTFRTIVVVCCTVTISNAQLPKASDYFPLQVGNVWQFRHYLQSGSPDQFEVVSDTLLGDTLTVYKALLKTIDNRAFDTFGYYNYNRDSTVFFAHSEFPQNPYDGLPWIDTRDGIGTRWRFPCGDTECGYALVDTGSAIFYKQNRQWADVYEVDAYQDTLKLLGKTWRFVVGIGPVFWWGADTLVYAKVNGIEFGLPVNVKDRYLNPVVPNEITLRVYPNPVRNGATIYLDSHRQLEQIEIKVVDILGRTVRTIITQPSSTVASHIPWDGKDQQGKFLPNGVYFVTVKSQIFIKTQKIIYLR